MFGSIRIAKIKEDILKKYISILIIKTNLRIRQDIIKVHSHSLKLKRKLDVEVIGFLIIFSKK